MDTRELTFGEKAVGLTFNPSNNPEVTKVKKLYAEIIDGLNEMRTPHSNSVVANEMNRLLSIAITEAQGAQMWAVKAITWAIDIHQPEVEKAETLEEAIKEPVAEEADVPAEEVTVEEKVAEDNPATPATEEVKEEEKPAE